MTYSLPPFKNLHGPEGADLREELANRKLRQRDLKVRSTDAEFIPDAAGIRLRLPEGAIPVRRDALADFGGRIGLARSRRFTPDLLNEGLAAQGDLLVRLEAGEVRAILPAATRLVGNLELLDQAILQFKRADTGIRVEHCREEDGELYLTAVAPQPAAEAGVGDFLYGGFILSNSETALLDTEACARIFRVACSNGALSDFNEGSRFVLPRILETGRPDPYVNWPARLGEVIARSFDGGNFDEDSRRFRATMEQILATPYEFLLNLVAQGLITEEERGKIQREFREADDATMYGLINAVTRIAHGMRDGNDLRRASDIERLAGEIIRGDHQPPVMEPSYR